MLGINVRFTLQQLRIYIICQGCTVSLPNVTFGKLSVNKKKIKSSERTSDLPCHLMQPVKKCS